MKVHRGKDQILDSIETERLLLRPLEASDAADLYAVLCDPEVMLYSDGALPQDSVQNWIIERQRSYTQWGYGLLAVVEKATQQLIGYCGLTRYENVCGRTEVEVGYRLRLDAWGKGFATEAAVAIKSYAVDSLKLQRLICLIHPENLPSIKVAQKLGMHFEAEYWGPGYTLADHVYTWSSHAA